MVCAREAKPNSIRVESFETTFYRMCGVRWGSGDLRVRGESMSIHPISSIGDRTETNRELMTEVCPRASELRPILSDAGELL